jgi:hypothetical protein
MWGAVSFMQILCNFVIVSIIIIIIIIISSSSSSSSSSINISGSSTRDKYYNSYSPLGVVS